MKNKKLTLAKKKKMYKDTFDPTSQSKYAAKKALQEKGNFSSKSPFSSKGDS